VDYGPILEMMGRPKRNQSRIYRGFVESGITDVDAAFIETKKRSLLSIGSEPCQERIHAYYKDLMNSYAKKEDISFRRERTLHTTEDVIDVVCAVLGVGPEALVKRRKDSYIRPLFAKCLCQYCDLTQRQVAELIGVGSGVAVCLQIKKVEEGLKINKILRKQILEIDKRLRQKA
jgi:hypothetical protein